MSAAPRRSAPAPADEGVVSLVAARIARALSRRERYKYVQPHVEREGAGWKVVSPNCSRNVDASGRAIDIAWLEPDRVGHWRLYSRDHVLAIWMLVGAGLTLDAALQQLCIDVRREFWK